MLNTNTDRIFPYLVTSLSIRVPGYEPQTLIIVIKRTKNLVRNFLHIMDGGGGVGT